MLEQPWGYGLLVDLNAPSLQMGGEGKVRLRSSVVSRGTAIDSQNKGGLDRLWLDYGSAVIFLP